MLTWGEENRRKTDLIQSPCSAPTQKEVVITSEHSPQARREDRFCTNESVGAGQGGRLEREGHPLMADQINRHAERKPPQTQLLLVVMRMRGSLEVLRIGLVLRFGWRICRRTAKLNWGCASSALSTNTSNVMLHTRSRIALRPIGCLGARREEMSTVTVLRVGRRTTRFASGVQWRVVAGGGSTGCSSGTGGGRRKGRGA